MANNDVYNQALTIRMFKPSSLIVDSVKQGSTNLNFSITGDTIQFNAIPDKGTIKLVINTLTSLNKIAKFNFRFSPNPFNESISFNSNSELKQIELFDLNGKRLDQILNPQTNTEYKLGKNVPSGVYLIKVTDINQNSTTNKVVKL